MTVIQRHQMWMAVHRYLGLATLAFLLISAVTGCLLCVDRSIDAALNPDLFSVPVRAVMSPVEAVERLGHARPDIVVTQFPLRAKAGKALELFVASRDPAHPLGFDQLFLDPHDGRITGARQSGPGLDRRHIVDAVFSLHYTLLAGRWGRWLMGVAALGWLVGNFVGFYLTLPVTGPFWRKWRRLWKVDMRARLRWVLLDLHRASGLWLLIGLTVLAFTSVSMNFFDEIVIPIASAASPARPSPFDSPAPPRSAGDRAGEIGFGEALAKAGRLGQATPLGWIPAVATYVPDRELYGVMFTRSGYEAYRGLGPVTVYLSARDSRLLYVDDPYHDSAGRQFSRALYPLHSGEVAGPIGTALIFILGLATTEMCVTGFYIWWKKRASRRKAGRTSQPPGRWDNPPA